MNCRGCHQGTLLLNSVRNSPRAEPVRYTALRHIQHDSRNRLTNCWVPPRTFKIKPKQDVDSNELLAEVGFLRRAHSGIFHLLPLGLRVQGKLERLIDKYMETLGASKVSLSSISSPDLWKRSGRLSTNPDLFKFKDRNDTEWLLSPTHEEEITSLVGDLVHSYRDLPIRLYQISRKYRDEPRPRQGLLRGKEFLMKDLYTFDIDATQALKTYETVKQAYRELFSELKLPYLMAEADSGNMGGSLSHEFHFPSPKGEDEIISCSNCDYVKNEELVNSAALKSVELPSDVVATYTLLPETSIQLSEFVALSKNKRDLIKVYVPRSAKLLDGSASNPNEVNPYAVKASGPDIDIGIEDPVGVWERHWSSKLPSSNEIYPKLPSIKYIFDHHVTEEEIRSCIGTDHTKYGKKFGNRVYIMTASDPSQVPNLVKAKSGGQCPVCEEGILSVQKAIEIGHTFHLGTRYSGRLGAEVTPSTGRGKLPIEMGCHGIGVSRLIAAVASALVDDKGLNWPAAIAPFQVVIIPRDPECAQQAADLYDRIASERPEIDVVIDDRPGREMIPKLFDADIIGFPVILVAGKDWDEGVEFQCRRMKITKKDQGHVPRAKIEDISAVIKGLLHQL